MISVKITHFCKAKSLWKDINQNQPSLRTMKRYQSSLRLHFHTSVSVKCGFSTTPKPANSQTKSFPHLCGSNIFLIPLEFVKFQNHPQGKLTMKRYQSISHLCQQLKYTTPVSVKDDFSTFSSKHQPTVKLNCGRIYKHCQRHNGPRVLTLYLELSLQFKK